MKWTTHVVSNQVPALADYNLYLRDRVLQEAVRREGGASHESFLTEYGQWLGRSESLQLGEEANKHPPELHTFDGNGRRVDRVVFHPAWHALMTAAVERGLHCLAWAESGQGAHVGRAAAFILHGQVEAGTLCPLTMTAAAIPLLQREPLFERIKPLLYSRQYDPSDVPLDSKSGMLVGMGMTEKQGGSDLRSNTTRAQARSVGGRGGEYSLIGHKWFFSVPTSDAHLVLATHEEQFSCFYVPRFRPDGSKNGVVIQRLKDKVGNRSNASAEVEFQDAFGVLVGEPGRGIATLVQMAACTRLDCILGSTALLRQGVVQAVHHSCHRHAFGKALVDQPLMRSVLADLALESEAATVLALRLARAFDGGDHPLEQSYRRILVPAAKFWICKRTVEALAECMEVWGGNGYVEDGPMGRLYREAPVNSIWEGSANVMCLDVLRALRRKPLLAQALADSLVEDSRDDPRLAKRATQLVQGMLNSDPQTLQAGARYLVQQLVLLVQANLLRRCAPDHVADAFIHTRLEGGAGRLFGALGDRTPTAAIFRRAWHE